MVNNFIEGSEYKRLNFPDPFGYGDIYKPIFPPYHKTMKAVLDNIPETISKVYVFGSSVRIDCATNTDIDVFLIGSLTNDDYRRIIHAIPEGETADILVETDAEFMKNLENGWSSLYRKVYEEGYKIYERKEK